MSQTFLITNATGVQGGSTARELLLRGANVHALVRNPSSDAAKILEALGATIFKGDFDDIPAIKEAITGVTGLQDPEAEIRYARNFVTTAKEAKTVTTFVVSTVWKSSEKLELLASKPEFPASTAFLKYYYDRKVGVEKVVKESAFPNWTVLRPDWLDYNYLAPPSAFLAPERFNGHTIELTGEPLTFDEVAKLLSDASGVEVKARYRTEEKTQKLLEAGTLPVLVSQLWAVEVAPIFGYDPKALSKYGIEFGTLEGYLEKEKGRLLKTLGVEK